MGLTSASLGLCGVVFSQVNDHFFSNHDDDEGAYGLLLFMSIAMAGGMALGAFVLGPLGPTDIPPIKTAKDDEEQPLLNRQEPKELSSLEFFLNPSGFALFTALFIVLGLGYVYLASIGQILLALPAAGTASPQHLRNVHVSVFSLANCSARAAFGTLSDVLKRKFGIHRLWIFVGATVGLLGSMTYLITSVSTAEELLPCTIAMAVMYGTVFGVAPAATTEFGTEVLLSRLFLFCLPCITDVTF